MVDMEAGTWTIIHSDGNSVTIQTTESVGGKVVPEIDGEDENVLAFFYPNGIVRIFPLATIFEINFVPEEMK